MAELIKSVALPAGIAGTRLDIGTIQPEYLASLNPEQLERFLRNSWRFPDNDLPDLVMGRAAAPDRRDNNVLQLLACGHKR